MIWHREIGRANKSLDGVRPKTHIVKNVRRYYKKKNQEAPHQQRDIHKELVRQQHREDQRNLRAEASFVASQFSTQLNAEFRSKYDASAEQRRVP